MDYEKKYKNSLEKAKGFYALCKKCGANDTADFIEDAFPELKESEDERTRKALIEVFSNREKYLIDQSFGDITVSEALAWLEKQGQENNTYVINNTPNCGISVYNEELKESEDEQHRKWILEYLYDGLRKSDEQFKSQFKCAIAWLEKQDEQNPANKIEPKFKVGDWITDGKALLYITKYESDYGYELKATDGKVFHFVSPELVEANYHLWSIEDAKDGDILVGYDWIFILKQFNSSGNNHKCYCHYDLTLDFFKDDTNSYMASGSNDFKPATKEQRDLLFAKMHEAGYEWDAEKKELKLLITNGGDFFESDNCEQKPAWSEEDETG